MVIYFSESVTANTGVDLVIKHCGSDHECVADDPVVNVYTVADIASHRIAAPCVRCHCREKMKSL